MTFCKNELECTRCPAGVTMPSSSSAFAPRLVLRVVTVEVWVGSEVPFSAPAARVLRVPIVRVLAGADLLGDCKPRVRLLAAAGSTATSSSSSCFTCGDACCGPSSVLATGSDICARLLVFTSTVDLKR